MSDQAVYTEDGAKYDSYDELIDAEANGYVVVAILRENAPKGILFPWVVGPFETAREAQNARARLRTKHARLASEGNVESELVSTHVKPSWKKV